MELLSLGYVGVNATDLAAWRDFATRLLAMQVVDESATGMGLRMDQMHQRMIIEQSDTDGGKYYGFEVADEAALRAAAAELSGRRIEVKPGTSEGLERRAIAGMAGSPTRWGTASSCSTGSNPPRTGSTRRGRSRASAPARSSSATPC